MAGKKASGRGDENAALGGGGKSRKKGLVIGNDDQYSSGTELSEKKGNHEGEEGEDEQVPGVVLVAVKKKLKERKIGAGGNTGFNWSNFGLLGGGDEDDNDGDDEEISKLTGEKDSEEEEEDEPVVSFKGKKKGKGNKKSGGGGGSVFSASGFDATDDGDQVVDKDRDDDDDVPVTEFTGQKKKSSKGGKKVAGRFSSKSNKKSVNNKFSAALLDEKSEDQVEETLKHEKKKKKSKSARDAQEEDDLNKILEELGDAPPTSKSLAPPPQEEKPNLQPRPVSMPDSMAEKEGEDEKEESAAAKKRKKKKKEKEKEKKAAAKEERLEEAKAETIEPKKTDAKGKGAEKKLPKHVREMQEALARRKEMEERKAREEEDNRRKEDEERLRQEELGRQAEEARRRKKEREKERLLKKKQEGKLLTGKQKEEQRRLEAMRYQILANATVTVPNAERDGGPTRRPRYQTRRSRPVRYEANGFRIEEPVEAKEKEQEEVHEVQSLEIEKFEPVEEEKTEVANELVEDGMEEDDDDEEWDAKSWDDVNLNVKGAFDDDEDSEPEPVLKKETKAPPAAAQPAIAVRKPVTSQPMDSHDVENKKSQAEDEVSVKHWKKDAAAKGKGAVSDVILHKDEEALRSPICCVMGHVDTGKTKLLDYIRGTHVQEGEARGITQQIGATFFPVENIRDRTKELKADARLNVPGLLVIDTPGHESFTNLRSHGSGLCDIAILVVNIMHGLEPQTIESLNLLRKRNTEFIVALNKIDRLYGWKTQPNAPIRKALKQQSKDVQNEFDRRLIEVITQLKEQGLNTELYYKNKDMRETFNIVPTSAISGEGIPDLLLLLIQWSQKTMVEKLTFRNEVQCTVLEIKVTKGHGTTIDVVLVNGVLHEGDQIVFCSLQGPIVTTIRALLMPHPMQELRVKGTYLHHKEIKAAQGIKITGQGLEHAIAGTSLHVVRRDDDLEEVKESAMQDMKSVTSRIDRSGDGVCVQASSLGSLEALLDFLKSLEPSIPVSGIGIGPVHKKDVMKASVMLEKNKEYANILAFGVEVTPEAGELADKLGVKIFKEDTIYCISKEFKAYIQNLKEERKREAAGEAIFPCVLEMIPEFIFNKKAPIVLGVDVLEGILKVGTPVCVLQKDFTDIGRIASIRFNEKAVDHAKKGQKVTIKIVGTNPEEQQKMHGRHFDNDDQLVSHITRRSIDVLKAYYRDDLSMEDWKLVLKLKTLFKIQ
ncbi:PREDICTED: eukaryotic translation initiation factor 5B-like [Populus euphratica]|uniref:Eukaryotic translation initiation factor 5B n=1 Tax=Populus euphratica TaxID=75702 RepID=A0AAJ6V157_POPEU|nr:PREDICTED: eukaryotic translation initiation factor 5B-like [Populus euphratica]